VVTFDEINRLKDKLPAQLGISKEIKLVESQIHGFLFEIDKKEGDAAFRKSKINYKTITTKGRVMSFTYPDLQDLVKKLNKKQEDYKIL